MAVEAVGTYFHYSKHRITDETLTLLLQLAEESGLRSRIDAMFRGDKINVGSVHGNGRNFPWRTNFLFGFQYLAN